MLNDINAMSGINRDIQQDMLMQQYRAKVGERSTLTNAREDSCKKATEALIDLIDFFHRTTGLRPTELMRTLPSTRALLGAYMTDIELFIRYYQPNALPIAESYATTFVSENAGFVEAAQRAAWAQAILGSPMAPTTTGSPAPNEECEVICGACGSEVPHKGPSGDGEL